MSTRIQYRQCTSNITFLGIIKSLQHQFLDLSTIGKGTVKIMHKVALMEAQVREIEGKCSLKQTFEWLRKVRSGIVHDETDF